MSDNLSKIIVTIFSAGLLAFLGFLSSGYMQIDRNTVNIGSLTDIAANMGQSIREAAEVQRESAKELTAQISAINVDLANRNSVTARLDAMDSAIRRLEQRSGN